MSAGTNAEQAGSSAIRAAEEVVEQALAKPALRPDVTAFFDEPINTASYVVRDPASRSCAIVDSVLDYDAAAGRTATDAADAIVAFVRKGDLWVEWILETHVHADHLSAAPAWRVNDARRCCTRQTWRAAGSTQRSMSRAQSRFI